MGKRSKPKISFFYSWDGNDGSLEFFSYEPKEVYGKLYGPFSTFAAARMDLIRRIKGDINELKLSLHEARAAMAPEIK